MVQFQDVEGVAPEDMLSQISFPYRVEKAVGADSELYTTKNVVIREDTEDPLGLISAKRGVIPHSEVASWVFGELNSMGVDYKIRDVAVNKRGDVYSEFIFRDTVETPDDEGMAPMLILRQSYIGTPVEVHMGTYRFVCSNGAMTGNTIESLKIKPNELDGYLKTSIRDDIHHRLSKFSNVSKVYRDMHSREFSPALFDFLLNEAMPTMLKKTALDALAEMGAVNILTEEKIKSPDFRDETSVKALYEPVDVTLSEYAFYNVLTQIVSHRARSAGARMMQSRAVSDFFNV